MGNFPIGEQTNYSIETGEEFALEFMLKRVNPRQLYNLSPPVEANNQSSEPVIKPIQPVSRTLSKNTTKVLCSFGGKIVPRPSDRKLRYVGGETRILRIGKEITWDEIRQRTLAIYPEPHSIKYQLPGEDLDLLVSVSCEEDVQNMMDECSVIDGGGSRKKLRVFLVSENENVDGNSDGSQQIARDTDCIDKNEPNHESEMKSDEKDKSARFGVGAGTLEHGDIINDINDRFPRDLISDIFGTAESSVGVDTHTAGLSVNMEFTDPKYWTLFERFAPGDFRKVSLVDQEPDIVTLPSDYDISQTNGVESLQSNQEISSRPVVSDDQDVKRTIQPAGVPLVDKNEPKHESEMKSALDGESALTPLEIHQRKTNEKDKSAHFRVGAGTLEHGDIFLQRPFSSGDFIRF